MPEIWVPFGPVEVSFDVKQENLSQILEAQPKKISKEELERKLSETARAHSVLLLSDTKACMEALEVLLSKSTGIEKIVCPKSLASIARKRAQERLIQVEELDLGGLTEIALSDGSQGKIFSQVYENPNTIILTSVHYDPLFGLTSAASDLISLSFQMKREAFKKSVDELPCELSNSSASLFATRILQTCPNVSVIEVIENAHEGLLDLFFGEPEATHAKTIEYWRGNFGINISGKVERIVFGCGGGAHDDTLTTALAHAFFNIAQNAVLDSGKLCMLAECSRGLGSEALLRFVTGRYTPTANLDQLEYFDGLEVLLSFFRVQKELELSLVSSLPKYYGEKFGFKTFSGAREAPGSIVAQGSRAKILVIPDAACCSVNLPENLGL